MGKEILFLNGAQRVHFLQGKGKLAVFIAEVPLELSAVGKLIADARDREIAALNVLWDQSLDIKLQAI